MVTFKEVEFNFKIVSKYLRRIHLRYGHRPLSDEDADQFRFCVKLWYFYTFDVSDLHPDTLTRQMCTLFSVPDLDVFELGKGLDEIITRLRLIADDQYHPGSYDRLKADVGQKARIILSMMRSDVTAYIDCPTPARLRSLSGFFGFPRKMCLRDIDNTQVLEADYIAVEQRIASSPKTVLSWLGEVVSNWDLKPDYGDFWPQHGPGRTAESSERDAEWKYNHFRVDDRLLMFYRRHGFSLAEFLPENCHPTSDLFRRSTTIFVPKTLKTKRVISAEPVAVQFTQQGLMRVILGAVKRSPLSRSINLRDQSLSQVSAKRASIDGDYATVDYSSASDSVSWELIKSAFPTWLVLDLYCTKTDSTILPSGTVIPRLQKLSPMGSSVCFPVECLVFSAMAELACHLTGCPVDYRVYGDDVILPASAVPKLTEISEDLGFQLNALKSYSNRGITSFREACGVEAMNGQDVSTVSLSRQFYLPKELTPTTTEIFDLLRSFYNNLKQSGAVFCARVLMELISLLCKNSHYFDLNPVNFLFSDNPEKGFLASFPSDVNWNLEKRFKLTSQKDCKCFQRKEVRCLTTQPTRPVMVQQDIAYFEWLKKAYLRSVNAKPRDHVYRVIRAGFIEPDRVIRTSTVSRGTQLRMRWVYVD